MGVLRVGLPCGAHALDVDILRIGLAHALDGTRERRMERETGFEPATSTLARSHSTTELFPLDS
jgi:hypothetical protein